MSSQSQLVGMTGPISGRSDDPGHFRFTAVPILDLFSDEEYSGIRIFGSIDYVNHHESAGKSVAGGCGVPAR
jgi:hypothetical protein